jgi:hypothetical protein
MDGQEMKCLYEIHAYRKDSEEASVKAVHLDDAMELVTHLKAMGMNTIVLLILDEDDLKPNIARIWEYNEKGWRISVRIIR